MSHALSYIKDIAYTKNDSNSTSLQRSQTSSLLKLPPELRNIVYREVLVSEHRIETNDTLEAMRCIVPRMQLLHICREIRGDAYDVFWGENSFHFTARDEEDFANLWNWIIRIGQKRAMLIKNFSISSMLSLRYVSSVARLLSNPNPRLPVSVYMLGTQIRLLRAQGVAVSAIHFVKPAAEDSSELGERVMSGVQDEYNKKTEAVLQEPMNEVHARIRATKKTTYRTATVGRCVIVIEDESLT